MRNTAEEIKERLSITEVVSNYLKLEKAGVNLRARCPFHTEKTASFYVSPGRNSFHCFGCGRSGDIFTFTELIEGMSFSDALQKLAERAGVKIVKGDFKDSADGSKKIITKINEEVVNYFEKNLELNIEAKEYLLNRGLSEESIKKFRLGFALNSWDGALRLLRSKGYKDEDIVASGVVAKTEKGLIDRFRSRIIFPLIDISGAIVGFSSRIFPPDREGPKYVNSPETLVFHKSKFLYGLNFARQEILKKGQVIIVEGQMDLIMSHQIGVTNAVAVSGTALTDSHLSMLKRFTNEVIYSFDGDDAGRKAAIRAFKISFENELLPKSVILEDGLDPADMAKNDKEKLLEVFKRSIPAIEWIIKTNKTDPKSQSFLGVIKEEVLPVISKIQSNIDKDYSIKMVAEILGVREESVRDDLVKVRDVDFRQVYEEEKIIPYVSPPTIQDIIIDKIIGIVLLLNEKDAEFVKDIKHKIKEAINLDIDERIKDLSDIKKNDLIFQAEFYAENEKEQKSMIGELVENLELDHLTKLFSEKTIKLRQIEKSGIETDEILKEVTEITNRINSIKIKNFNKQ
ncbi:MAG TPA: DNA primase [Candidatus Paceibacterota bacterium]|nr:DNA primase [Candidatus Paceibacterota bacterium]